LKEHIQDMNDDLLVKHLIGEATHEENKQVETWLAEDPANQHYYAHFKLIWEESLQLAAKSSVDENDAWVRMQQRLQRGPATPTIVKPMYQRMGWWRIAAAVIVMVGAAWFALTMLSPAKDTSLYTTLYSNDKVIKDTLPDGSIITLNKHATFSYPKKFTGTTRTISLEGEAFFDIAHDKSKPFIIHTNDVTIKVVGTSFNVKSTAKETEVIVETGIVEVARKNFAIQLTKHEKTVLLNDQQAPVKQQNTDELYNYYRTNTLVCNGTPLWRLVDILNQAYNVQIVIENDKLKELPLNTTFNNESLDNILNLIIKTFDTYNIQIEHHGQQIILK
jgi:transmembrane sensor